MDTPQDILGWLNQHEQTLRKSERKVAEYVRRHPQDVIHMRIVDLATEAHVSEPTIVRFCRALGYASFQKFKVHLAQQLVQAQAPVIYPVQPGDTIDRIGEKVVQGIQHALARLLMDLDWKAMQAAADAIRDSRRLLLFGFGASGAVAQDAQQKFFRLKLDTLACQDPDTQVMAAALLDEQDVVLAISHSGRNRNLLDACQRVRESGARLITLCPSGCPLARLADILLAVRVSEDTETFTPLASRLIHLAVLDILATELYMQMGESAEAQLQRVKANLRTLRWQGDA